MCGLRCLWLVVAECHPVSPERQGEPQDAGAGAELQDVAYEKGVQGVGQGEAQQHAAASPEPSAGLEAAAQLLRHAQDNEANGAGHALVATLVALADLEDLVAMAIRGAAEHFGGAALVDLVVDLLLALQGPQRRLGEAAARRRQQRVLGKELIFIKAQQTALRQQRQELVVGPWVPNALAQEPLEGCQRLHGSTAADETFRGLSGPGRLHGGHHARREHEPGHHDLHQGVALTRQWIKCRDRN